MSYGLWVAPLGMLETAPVWSTIIDANGYISYLMVIALRTVPAMIGLVLATGDMPAECDNSTPNADIVGSGVRWSIYLVVLFVFVSLSMASLHKQQSGTKELGCAVLIS